MNKLRLVSGHPESFWYAMKKSPSIRVCKDFIRTQIEGEFSEIELSISKSYVKGFTKFVFRVSNTYALSCSWNEEFPGNDYIPFGLSYEILCACYPTMIPVGLLSFTCYIRVKGVK